MPSPPDLTVCMITDDTYAKCARTISYLARQTVVDRIELLIVGPSEARIAPRYDELSPFHSVRIVEMGEVGWVGEAVARGVHAASAPYFVYAEEHGFPPEDWAEVLIRTFEAGGYDAVGWGMLPSNPGLVAWAHIYGQFGDAVAPLASGSATRLGPHHGAYRRDLLTGYGDELASLFGNEGVLYPELVRRGKAIYLTGETVTGHTQISNLSDYIWLEFIGQRVYAASRMRFFEWPLWKRIVYIAGSPLIPLVRLSRSIGHVSRTGRSRELLPQVAVVMLAANIAGALGEAVGYAIGADDKTRSDRMGIELDRYSFVNKADRDQRHAFATDSGDAAPGGGPRNL